MEEFNNQYGIVFPKGFKCGSIHSGIKKRKKDLMLIYSELPAVASGVFTQNKVKAAPVVLTQKKIVNSNIRGIVVNSGNANACTGKKGYCDAETMCQVAAECLCLKDEEILVASTGVIGIHLPMKIIVDGIRNCSGLLGNSKDHGEDAAEAILTTDTNSKSFAEGFEFEGKSCCIGGICKGSGMVHPNMATTLGFITTDIAIEKELLDEILKEGINKTFNCITIDRDTSTNDMVIVMANGASGICKVESKNDELYDIFNDKLVNILNEMAKSIVRDGEGATKFIEIRIDGAKNENEAIKAGKAVATSNLVKTAAFGEDANWGRILSAVGNSGIDFNPEDTNIYIGSKQGELLVCEMGQGLSFDEDKARKILKEKDIYYLIEMGEGKGDAIVYTCDLSYDYVKINGNYRS